MDTTEDIRDVNIGETYFVLADKTRGGRCVMSGIFIAVWRTKAEAKTAAQANPDLTVVKQIKV